MSKDLDLYIDQLYHQRLREAGGNVPIGDLREKIAPEVEAFIAHQDRDIHAEALAAVTVRTERTRRRLSKTLKTDIEFLLDSLANPDEGAVSVIAILDQGYKVGDGTDKTLRYWTHDDLGKAVLTRYQESAAAVVAAKEFDETAQRAHEALNARDAKRLGQIFNDEAA